MARELAELVLSGTKRATASSPWTFAHENRTPPRPGDLSNVTRWDGQPLCIIETTAIEQVPFDQVTDAFARAEGEGDRTLRSWRKDHAAFFTRECARIGRAFSTAMPVLCERFRVAYQPSDADSAG